MKKITVKKGDSYLEAILLLKEQNKKVFFLEGDLGAGKTTFTSEFIKNMSGEALFENLGVMSPTYSIVNEYLLKDILILHSDFYRINDDLFEWEEFLERVEDSSFAFIEWGEKVPQISENILNYSKVKIIILENGDREVQITEV